MTATFVLSGTPALGISPGSGDFGIVNVDSTAPKVFTLSNNGSVDLVIASMEMTGGDAAMFRLAARRTKPLSESDADDPPGRQLHNSLQSSLPPQ